MTKKVVLGLSAVVAISMLSAGPVMAKEFKTADGNITIQLPDEGWSEVIDPEAEFVFTNGMDVISAMKYDPEEKVEVARNDEYYNAVLQLTYAYSDQLIVLTAQVADAPHLSEIFDSITSIKFSGISSDDDAKKDLNNYTISDADMTMYVNVEEGLNLRESFSVTSDILTTIPHGEALHVTGVVKFNGDEIGWDRVEYDGLTGYVASGNLVENEEDLSENPTFDEIADDISYNKTMYYSDGTPVKIVVLNDGTMLDMNGYRVVGFADGACRMHDGTVIYDFDPTKMSVDEWLMGGAEENYDDTYVAPEASGEYFDNSGAGRELYVQSEYDGDRTIYSGANGLWYDKEGNTYYQDTNTGAFISNGDGGSWWYNE